MKIEEEIKVFQDYAGQMTDTFIKKRRDYGQTTTETYDKFGPVSMLTRMHDKLGRLDNIVTSKKIEVLDESVKDTLLDLANYCIIFALEIDKHSQKN